jgi:hypothetical protein
MIAGLCVSGITALFIPLASGANLVSVLLLVAAQLGDGFYVAYEINQVSLRQSIAGERMLGRVNATMRFVELGAILLGSLAGGLLGGVIGVRLVLVIGGCATLLAAGILALSPLGKVDRERLTVDS